MDFKNMGAKRVCVVTDSVVRHLDAMKQVEEGLTREGVEFTVFDGCRVEPKDSSYAHTYFPPSYNFSNVETGLRKQLILPYLTSQTPSLPLVAVRLLTRQNS